MLGGRVKVFYKMKGDYWRYLAEFKGGAERKEAAEETLLAYKSAEQTARLNSRRRTRFVSFGAQLFRLLL